MFDPKRRLFLKNSALLLGTTTGANLLPPVARALTATRKRSAFSTEKRVIELIRRAGQSSDLVMCMDAGDIDSYSGGTLWKNLAPASAGQDFFFGMSESADASDPAFNGTIGGLSSSEYFSLDGGDVFFEASSGLNFADSWSKDNAAFTLAGVAYWSGVNNGHNQYFFSTASTMSSVGMMLEMSSTGKLAFRLWNGTGTAGLAVDGTTTITANQWIFLAISLKESTGANGAILQVGSVQQTFNSTYTSPSAAASNSYYALGAAGVGPGACMANGSRIAAAMGWNRAFSAAELTNLRTLLKNRRWSTLV